ncbi:hypothetical protein AAG570_003116 [Ranatra chinensis]|uniref:Uncharacterized protein n=1 Tax=Ranatra chinensis TaxID=642074 RepID=A0ABD0Y5X2_9HEMI
MSESEVKSPIKGMPDCWQDEKRMNSLFLPFKKKELNPVDWESKMKFWRGSVEQWSLQKEDCLVSVKKLEAEFKRKERVPMCLATVIDNLLRSGDLKPKDEFLNLNPQQTWTNWAINSFVKVPVVWSFTKIKEALLEVDDTQIEYVYLAYLKNRGDILLSAIRSRNASLLSLEEILHILTEEGYCVSIETLNFIIHWLQIQRLAVLINFEKRILVKFSADNKPVINISEAEAAAITLQQTTVALKKNIESLELEKQQTIDEARNYVKKGMRQSVRTFFILYYYNVGK